MTSEYMELETLFAQHGYAEYKWIDPADMVVSQWVRMKCTFGCGRVHHCQKVRIPDPGADRL